MTTVKTTPRFGRGLTLPEPFINFGEGMDRYHLRETVGLLALLPLEKIEIQNFFICNNMWCRGVYVFLYYNMPVFADCHPGEFRGSDAFEIAINGKGSTPAAAYGLCHS